MQAKEIKRTALQFLIDHYEVQMDIFEDDEEDAMVNPKALRDYEWFCDMMESHPRFADDAQVMAHLPQIHQAMLALLPQ